MMRGIFRTLGLFLVLSPSAFGDIGLIPIDGVPIAVFREDHRVFFLACDGPTGQRVDRRCVNHGRRKEMVYAEFIPVLHGTLRIPAKYRGQRGLIDVSIELERTLRRMEDPRLDAEERKDALGFVSHLKGIQTLLLQAKNETLDYLAEGSYLEIDAHFRRERYLSLTNAYPQLLGLGERREPPGRALIAGAFRGGLMQPNNVTFIEYIDVTIRYSDDEDKFIVEIKHPSRPQKARDIVVCEDKICRGSVWTISIVDKQNIDLTNSSGQKARVYRLDFLDGAGPAAIGPCKEIDGHCWYLGAIEQSCTSVCGRKPVDEASNSSDKGLCKKIASAFGVKLAVRFGELNCGVPIGCFVYNGEANHCGIEGQSSYAYGGDARFCACKRAGID